MNLTKIKIFSIIIIAAITMATTMNSCDNGSDCNINNVSYNRIQLYDATNPQDTIAGNYSYPGTLTVKLLINGKDSIVVNMLTDASELQLPVSYTQECDTLIFEYRDNITDTLFVGHTNIPYFISTDCGIAMHHRLTNLRYTHNLIDSAAIKEPTINFNWHENIKLYIFE